MVVPVDRNHVLRRVDRHVHRAAVWCSDLAAAARSAPERADRRVQYLRADLLQRQRRAVLGSGQERTSTSAAKGWLLVTFVLGCVFLGVKMYEYNAKFSHGIYPWKPHSRIYEKADLNYAAAVRTATRGAQDRPRRARVRRCKRALPRIAGRARKGSGRWSSSTTQLALVDKLTEERKAGRDHARPRPRTSPPGHAALDDLADKIMPLGHARTEPPMRTTGSTTNITGSSCRS